MPDREKVIKALKTHLDDSVWCDECIYRSDEWCMPRMHADILALLEQEPVEPEVYYVGTDKYKFYRCPVCKIDWHYKGNYCLGCGRSVKWND